MIKRSAWKNQRRWRWAITAFITVAALLVFWQLLPAAMSVLAWLWQAVGTLLSALAPIGYAFVVAYLMHPGVRFLERRVFANAKPKRRYPLAVALAYALLVGAVYAVMAALLPALADNVREALDMLPRYMDSVQEMIRSVGEIDASGQLAKALSGMQETMALQLGELSQSVLDGALRVLQFAFTAVVAVVVSFYMLMEKKTLLGGIRMCSEAVMGKARTLRVSAMLQKIDRLFGQYASGKLLEAAAVTALCLLGFWMTGVPYAALMAALVGVLSLVPYLGPLIAAAPLALVTLVDAPDKLIYVALVFLAVFAIDAYYIGPRLVGGKLGLSGFWVIFGVMVGRGVAGIAGMVLGVPVVALLRMALYGLVYRQKRRQKRKRQLEELPVSDIHDD